MLQSTSPHCPHTTTTTTSSFYCSSKPTTMEEVWKDINLAALTDHHPHPPSRDGIILQDFLAAPFNDQPPPTPPPPPPRNRDIHAPATVLSLNSRLDFHYLDNSDHHINANPFEALASSAQKRLQDSHGGSTDRRHKRMIKNRESAARSRARKQAYTNELELEVAHLLEENARLKRQQEQLCVAAAAQLPKKHTLQRTSTAPF